MTPYTLNPKGSILTQSVSGLGARALALAAKSLGCAAYGLGFRGCNIRCPKFSKLESKK